MSRAQGSCLSLHAISRDSVDSWCTNYLGYKRDALHVTPYVGFSS